jgi:hypothetical protein
MAAHRGAQSETVSVHRPALGAPLSSLDRP